MYLIFGRKMEKNLIDEEMKFDIFDHNIPPLEIKKS